MSMQAAPGSQPLRLRFVLATFVRLEVAACDGCLVCLGNAMVLACLPQSQRFAHA